ncbi:MAG: hypothetical protein IT301_17300 [Dehalococcoidia bacterium]|nr:hypothetical protein [Dehalococcoidia bacterium]
MHYQHSNNDDATGRILEGLQCDRSGCVCRTSARAGKGLTHCPAHDDLTPSLNVSPPSRTAWPLLCCFAGCQHKAVLGALRDRGLVPRSVGFQVGAWTHYREDRPGEAKRVRWTPGAEPRLALYRGEALAELDPGATVLLTEGEAAAEAAVAMGFAAVGTACGASATPDDAALEVLRGFDVVMCQDNDDAGFQHMQRIGQRLAALGIGARWLELPGMLEHGDLADFGGSRDELVELVAAAPAWTPPADPGPVETSAGGEVRLTFDDTSNAELLARLHGQNLRHDPSTGRLLEWTGGPAWKPLSVERARQLAIDGAAYRLRTATTTAEAGFAARSRDLRRLDAALELVKSLPPVYAPGIRWDDHPDLLAVANGVIDLRDGSFRPGRREDYLTTASEVPYDPAAECPRWTRFVNEITMGDVEVAEFLQRLAGYSLSGCANENIFVLLIGEGRNGKGKFLNLLRAVAGSELAATVRFAAFLSDARGDAFRDIADTVNARVVVSSETVGDGGEFDSQVLKSLTGSEDVVAAKKYGHAFRFRPRFTLWLLANHRPRVSDHTTAMWERMVIIPFYRQFIGEDDDKNLETKLMGELSGVLNWMIEGAKDWYRDGLRIPDSIHAERARYRTSEDAVGRFLIECCRRGPDLSIGAGDLYRAFATWCQAENLAATSSTAFGRRLSELFTKTRTAAGLAYDGIALDVGYVGLTTLTKNRHTRAGEEEFGENPTTLHFESSNPTWNGSNIVDHRCGNDFRPMLPGEVCADCGWTAPAEEVR